MIKNARGTLEGPLTQATALPPAPRNIAGHGRGGDTGRSTIISHALALQTLLVTAGHISRKTLGLARPGLGRVQQPLH